MGDVYDFFDAIIGRDYLTIFALRLQDFPRIIVPLGVNDELNPSLRQSG